MPCKRPLYILPVILVALSLLVSGCTLPPKVKEFTEDESREIARQFVLTSPTYQFDGSGLNHTGTLAGNRSQCWTFTFRFQSSHSGYGFRAGQMLAQVITPHTAVVMLEKGGVKSGVLDGKWDMIMQKRIIKTDG